MKSYVVNWEIELEAANPIEAAKLALAIQRDSDSVAAVFDVSERSKPLAHFEVDLLERNPRTCICTSCGSSCYTGKSKQRAESKRK